ncbi:MAG: hypothetical protein M0Z69_10295, partial [Actinomycetota bacterium]|nr:hypothetical protein [Actinomycetota bacterium]
VVPFIVWSALRSRGHATGPSGKPLMFADLYNHAWAAASYATTTASVAALCLGLGARLPLATAMSGVLLVLTGIMLATNLSVRPVRLLLAGRRDSRDSAASTAAPA